MSVGVIIKLFAIVIACIAIVYGVCVYVHDVWRYNQFKKEEGITIFGTKMKTYDYLCFINTLISYLMIDGEVNLHNFIDINKLRVAPLSDFELIGRTINSYPIVFCVYLGDYKFKLDKGAMSKKYGAYQQNTGWDNYIIPLFSNHIIEEYKDLFNFSTKYQQTKVFENIMNRDMLSLNFDACDESLEYAMKYEEKEEEFKIKRRISR